jgi:hypothetical protein
MFNRFSEVPAGEELDFKGHTMRACKYDDYHDGTLDWQNVLVGSLSAHL